MYGVAGGAAANAAGVLIEKLVHDKILKPPDKMGKRMVRQAVSDMCSQWRKDRSFILFGGGEDPAWSPGR